MRFALRSRFFDNLRPSGHCVLLDAIEFGVHANLHTLDLGPFARGK
jgi:hypothetical protein